MKSCFRNGALNRGTQHLRTLKTNGRKWNQWHAKNLMKVILMKFYHFATTLVEASSPGFLCGERRCVILVLEIHDQMWNGCFSNENQKYLIWSSYRLYHNTYNIYVGWPVQRRVGPQGAEVRVGQDGGPTKGLQVEKQQKTARHWKYIHTQLLQGSMGKRPNGGDWRNGVAWLWYILYWIMEEARHHTLRTIGLKHCCDNVLISVTLF